MQSTDTTRRPTSRSDPDKFRRDAIESPFYGLKNPKFGDQYVERYFGSDCGSEILKHTLAPHLAKSESRMAHPSWDHASSVYWADLSDPTQGVDVCLFSMDGSEMVDTQFRCRRGMGDEEDTWQEIRSPSAILEPHFKFDVDTKSAFEAARPIWEGEADSILETLSQYGLEEPFTGSSRITGHVSYLGPDTSSSGPLALQIDLPPSFQGIARSSLRYSLDVDGLTRLEAVPPVKEE
jgi:hypothetical protein